MIKLPWRMKPQCKEPLLCKGGSRLLVALPLLCPLQLAYGFEDRRGEPSAQPKDRMEDGCLSIIWTSIPSPQLSLLAFEWK